MQYDNIDIYSIATNGLIAENPKYFILDPLGYYVLKVEEEIIPAVIGGGMGGGGLVRDRKRIKIQVVFSDNIPTFDKEFYVDNVNMTVTGAKLDDSNKTIVLEITDVSIGVRTEKIIHLQNVDIS